MRLSYLYVFLIAFILSTLIAESATLKEGIAAYNQGKIEKANSIFEALLASDPSNMLVRFNLAGSYYANRSYDKAISNYLVVANSDSSLGIASNYFIAEINYILKKDEQAILYLKKIQSLTLPSQLDKMVHDLSLKLERYEQIKPSSFWGYLDFTLLYSDNSTLLSEQAAKKVKGFENYVDFNLAYDWTINNQNTLTPMFTAYFEHGFGTNGFDVRGQVYQISYKMEFDSIKSFTLSPSHEKAKNNHQDYLSKNNLVMSYKVSGRGHRYNLNYIYQIINDDLSFYNYLAGTAHYFSFGTSSYFGFFSLHFGGTITNKELNDTSTIASSYSAYDVMIGSKIKFNKTFSLNGKIKYENKSYKKKELGWNTKRKDQSFKYDLSFDYKISKLLSSLIKGTHYSNKSTINTVAANREYSVNTIELGIVLDF